MFTLNHGDYVKVKIRDIHVGDPDFSTIVEGRIWVDSQGQRRLGSEVIQGPDLAFKPNVLLLHEGEESRW